jgi:ArsR family transcriptional regulator
MSVGSYDEIGLMEEQRAEQCQEACFHPDVVESVRRAMPDEPLQQELAQLFKVLGDYTRIRILNALYRSELCVCDLTAILGMNQSAVSHQLRVLRDAKIVRSRKLGKNVLYSLDDIHISGLIGLGSEHVLEGEV